LDEVPGIGDGSWFNAFDSARRSWRLPRRTRGDMELVTYREFVTGLKTEEVTGSRRL
jgi:hypothetical protein